MPDHRAVLPNRPALVGDPVGPVDARRTVARALTLGLLALAGVFLTVAMIDQTGGNAGVLVAWQQLLLAGTAVVILGLCVTASVPVLNWLLAGAFALVGLMPSALALARDQPTEPNLLVFGLVGAALSVGCALGRASLWRGAVLALLTLLVWISLAGVLFLPADSSFDVFYERNSRDLLGLMQVRGIAGHPNALALVAVLALILQIQSIRLLAGKRHTVRYPELASAGMRVVYFVFGPLISLTVLALTQSRTGWLIGGAALLVILVPLPRTGRTIWVSGILGVAALVSLLPYFLADGLSSFHGRVFAWKVALEEFLVNPLVGGGTQTFTPEYWEDAPWSRLWADQMGGSLFWEPAHAHNQWLEAMALGGLVLLSALLLLFAILAYVAVKAFDLDGRWMMGLMVIAVITGSVEVVLGVGLVSGTYLLPLVLGAVAGSSATLLRRQSSVRLA